MAPAHAAPPPVCSRIEVLDVVANEIARRGVSAVIVPGYFGEILTPTANTVLCSVRVHSTFYDTNRFGNVPQVRLSTLEFTVRAGRNGLFVDGVGEPR